MATVRVEGAADEIVVGNIFCLGRNYAAHIREMNAEVPASPVVFLKPPSALVDEDAMIQLPSFSQDVQHEVEMVVLIGMEGREITEADAMDYVTAYGVGLDLTARDVQAEAKKKGLPWTISKGFDCAAPVSRFVRASQVADPHDLDLSLSVNGERRQSANTSLMIHRIDAIIAYLSRIFTLNTGDLIYTGTPEGVGPIRPGDRLDMALGDVVEAHFQVAGE